MFEKIISILHSLNWRNIIWLFGVQFLSLAASIGIGKITSLYVPPNFYGDYILIFGLANLVIGLLFRPIIQNFSFQFSQNQSVVWKFTFGLMFLFLVLFFLLTMGLVFFQLTSFFSAILIFCSTVFQVLVNFGNSYYQLKGEHKNFGIIQILSSFVQLSFLLICWYFFRQGTDTELWMSLLIGNLVVLSFIFFRNFKQAFIFKKNESSIGFLKTHIPPEFRKASFVYISPLILFAFLSWLTDQFDRWIIVSWLDTYQVGIYSMAVSVGSKVSVLSAPLLTFVYPKVFACQTANSYKSALSEVKKISYIFIGMATVAVLLLFFGGGFLGVLLLSPSYSDSFPLFYIIAIAYSCTGLIFFKEVLFYASGNTKFLI